MKKMIFEIGGVSYKRVTKPVARRTFNAGKNIILCPCNLRPGKPWNPESLIKSDFGVSFNQITNSFEYYNCNALAGYYAAFYIEV